MHNKRLSHEEEKPCFVCGDLTKALHKGKIQAFPRCSKCRERLHVEFQQATAARRRQEGRRGKEE